MYRLVSVQSLSLERRFPLLKGEISVHFKRTPGKLDLGDHKSDSQSLFNKMQAKITETSNPNPVNWTLELLCNIVADIIVCFTTTNAVSATYHSDTSASR